MFICLYILSSSDYKRCVHGSDNDCIDIPIT